MLPCQPMSFSFQIFYWYQRHRASLQSNYCRVSFDLKIMLNAMDFTSYDQVKVLIINVFPILIQSRKLCDQHCWNPVIKQPFLFADIPIGKKIIHFSGQNISILKKCYTRSLYSGDLYPDEKWAKNEKRVWSLQQLL